MAHQHRGQARPNSLRAQALHLFRNFLLDGGRNGRAVQNLGHDSMLKAGGKVQGTRDQGTEVRIAVIEIGLEN